MKLLTVIILLSICSNLMLKAQNSFEEKLSDFLQQEEYKNASVGIHLLDLDSDSSLFGLNENNLFVPASILKLITTATALDILGPEYQFVTELGYTGKTGRNVLKGNLVLIGGADPALGSSYFQNFYFNTHFLDLWAEKVKSAGITKIEGDLVLDASVYDLEKVPPTWIWEDIGNYYGAGASAFTVYDNLFRITFNSPNSAGQKTKIINYYPKVEGIYIKNEVLSSDIQSDLAYVFGSPFDKSRMIRGTIPKNRRAFTIKAALPNPGEILANDFLSHLAKHGIFVSGKIQFKHIDKQKIKSIYLQESPKLSTIVKITNYKSINLFAEHLLKQIAVENSGFGSRKEGIKIVKKHWQNKGINTNHFFMEDGSGLSPFNAVSPAFFTSVLQKMKNNPAFVNSLPEAGTGTLNRFQKSNFPNHSLHAKSGSMTRVRCYAGYLKTDSGKNLAFSIMVNHFSGSHSKLIGEIQNLLMEITKIKVEK